ncbi:MAG TPA: hypothetical protein VMY42_10585 [Thermoguttaceae bacterium]|nr:hypothetical protein [Thermoguttaceae bacterium]
MFDWPAFFSRPSLFIPCLALCIPIVSILVGGICGIVKMLIAHRERMTMIQQGMHPDHPLEEDDQDEAES